MLSKETLEELGQINSEFNEICDDLFGFKYETDGFWYECITFGNHVLWDSEDLTEHEEETVIECVKRRYNDFLDNINQTRYLDVPPSERKFNKDISDAFNEIVDDLTDRKGLRQAWYNIDEDTQQEIMDKWYNILKKFI